jgi:ribosomal protein S18 acetylase RimI-like enzyme
MVDSNHREVGVGRTLIAASERALKACGFSIATLWVVPENLSAIRCYERCGWHPDGAQRRGNHCGREIRSIRYRRALEP